MRISNFKYENKAYKWALNEANFEKLTLLVGASGVGKTQILKAIYNLKGIAKGKNFSGVSWSVDFDTLKGDTYNWNGKFEDIGQSWFSIDKDDDEARKAEIITENVTKNGKSLIKRNDNTILFDGKETVKLSKYESIINLLKEEDEIKLLYKGLQRIKLSDHSDSIRAPYKLHFLEFPQLLKKYDTLEKIRESDEETLTKLYLTYKNDEDTFLDIKERYSDIFPQVEDIKIEPADTEKEDLPLFMKDYPVLQIKESGVDDWIPQSRISSGMYRTLIHLSEVYLCPEGSVFLIDEFENSLGVNCINEITDDIFNSGRNIQFVITSHHPYIINRIPTSLWKLVTRNFGKVKIQSLERFKIGQSKHESFMQLIQLEEFQTGMEVS